MNRRWQGLQSLALLSAVHCGPSAPPSEYPGDFVDPSTIAENFVLRQHVEGGYGPRKVSFDAVVQKQGDTLLVLTLTPYGSRAFAVELQGSQVHVEKFIPRELPFDPKFILLDVQRTFFVRLPHAPLDDGWHRARVGEEIVRERWQQGRLFERRFTRRDHRPKGAVIVSFAGGYVPGAPPPRVTLVNEWYGYTLDLVTSDYQAL